MVGSKPAGGSDAVVLPYVAGCLLSWSADYTPLFQLLRSLVSAREAVLALSGPQDATGSPSKGAGGAGPWAADTAGTGGAGEGALAAATTAAERVTQQTLELLLGLVASHAQVVGASAGPGRLVEETTRAWVPLFMEAPTHLYAPRAMHSVALGDINGLACCLLAGFFGS